MTTLTVGDQRLDYTRLTEGKGPPLIFLHGIISSQYTWLDFPQRFAHYGSIITLTLPGHYPARFPEGMRAETISDAWVGETLAGAIEQITEGERAILVGHSTGGYGALAVAWRAPHLVRAAISLAGFVRGTWNGTLGMMQQLRHLGRPGDLLFDALIRLLAGNEALIDYSWRQCSYYKEAPRYNSVYQKMRPQIYSDLRHLDGPSMRAWFYRMREVADLTPYLPQITVPVLALAGAQDSLAPPEQTLLMGERIPGARALLLDKMDHALFVEQPERVYTCVNEWLDEQGL